MDSHFIGISLYEQYEIQIFTKNPRKKIGLAAYMELWTSEGELLRTKQVGNNANSKALTSEPQLVDVTQMFLPHTS